MQGTQDGWHLVQAAGHADHADHLGDVLSGRTARSRSAGRESAARAELITPALVLDVDMAQRNIDRMASELRRIGSAVIRPHYKTHKSPELARRQVDAGAGGLSMATVWEAAVLAGAGQDTCSWLIRSRIQPRSGRSPGSRGTTRSWSPSTRRRTLPRCRRRPWPPGRPSASPWRLIPEWTAVGSTPPRRRWR